MLSITRKNLIYLLLLNFFIACQSIETGDTIDKKTIAQLKEMGLLDNDEKVVKFYSNYEKDKAGNFFTNKRIAHYWFDKQDVAKQAISFAYYEEIVAIDTTLKVYNFDIPYMIVTKTDSTSFRVYIDGTAKQKRDFFIEAISIWKKHRAANK